MKKGIRKNIIAILILMIMISLGFIFQDSFSNLFFIQCTHLLLGLIGVILILIIILLISLLCKRKEVKEYWNSIGDIISSLAYMFSFIYVFFALIITPVTVIGDSMQNTFFENDKVLVYHLTYEIKKDDVVIIDAQDRKYEYLDEYLIKRVIAVAGDVVTFSDNKVYVNGEYVEDVSYLEFREMTHFDNNYIDVGQNEKIVDEGYFIALGDNRLRSLDSRRLGMFSTDDLLGHVVYRIYPFSSFGKIEKDMK